VYSYSKDFLKKKPNKLSFSKIKTYQDCGRKYDYHYNQRLRSERVGSPLVFGHAIDSALNELVTSKDLDKSLEVFTKSLKEFEYNGSKIDIFTTDKVDFMDSDFTQDILSKEDLVNIKTGSNKFALSLLRKGEIIIRSYNDYIIPKISKVLMCQQRVSLKNEDGDELEGIIDLILEFKDGSVYLLDNKTSSRDYKPDSAGKSGQLLIYEYLLDKYDLDGIGFIVLNKNIWLRKVKVCSVCGHNGSGKNNRSCDAIIDNVRCMGPWTVTVDPKCFITMILNKPNRDTQAMVLDTVDVVNTQIKNNQYPANLDSCIRGKIVCPYYNKCHGGSDKGLIKVPERK
jgi:PD-(D/E)XK nuclease superfamily